MNPLTKRELQILRHSLGLNYNGEGSQYRNHFVTGPGSDDWAACNSLCDQGLMIRHEPSEVFGGDYCFQVTAIGRINVNLAKPIPERVPRSRQRYLRWIKGASDSMSFGDWLKSKWSKDS